MKQIYETLIQNKSAIDDWMQNKSRGLVPPVFLSCDLRHSGNKISIIDSNLFPAGFNNLCNAFSKESITGFENYFKKYHPDIKSILLLAEDHTRNKYYLKNISRLTQLLTEAKYSVVVGIIGEEITGNKLDIDVDGYALTLHKIKKVGKDIIACETKPDIILSNNDFSNGVPQILNDINQSIIPHVELGWFNRKKSQHFKILQKLCEEFGRQFDMDPWFIHAYFEESGPINLSNDVSLAGLAHKVDQLILKISAKYKEYGINESPYVYLKNDRGTYGMGLLPVFSGEEVLALNRKKKNKLLSSKGGTPVTEFILQEGIPTIDSYSGYPIEPVIYAVGGKDIGGFFRIHESKNELESLNAPGMTFSCLCLHKLDEPHENFFIDCKEKEKLVVASRFLACLDAIAASCEII